METLRSAAGAGSGDPRTAGNDPVTGRFISEDPAFDGVNWYAYCENNPANCVDPSGCSTLAETMQSVNIGMALEGMASSIDSIAWGVCAIIVGYCAARQLEISSVMLSKKDDIKEIDGILDDLGIKHRDLRREIHDEMDGIKQKGQKLSRKLVKQIGEALRDQSRGKGDSWKNNR